MATTSAIPQLNAVRERLLFLSPVVQAGWEKESAITDFEKVADLGQGAFGLVTKVKHKKSQIMYAIKQMDKKRLKASGMIDQIKTEIKIMYSLNHENIVKLFNHFEDDNYIYLVIDYAPGVQDISGQLWDRLQKSPGKRLPEKEVVVYVKDLVSSLEYLHGKGIIHRDIKPENLLLDGKGHLKLADFGWSNYFKSDASRTTFCGTLDYLAPEMLESGHHHDHMVDIWAIGVLIYELLTGKSPFSPTTPTLKLKEIERGTQQNIVQVKFEFPKDFPALAKDLVSKILRKNPKTRLNLFEIKSHPWVKCTALVVKKKELDPQALIDAVTFGQNMADKKKFAQFDAQNYGGVGLAFTEEEIIQYAKPDSMLDKAHLEAAIANKTMNVDKQLLEFRQQMGLMAKADGTANPSGVTTNGDSSMLNQSGISDTSSNAQAKELEYKLIIKTDECNMLQKEVEKLKKLLDEKTGNELKSKILEEENLTLRNQLKDLYKKMDEKDLQTKINPIREEELEKKVVLLEEQFSRERRNYEKTISEYKEKVDQLSKSAMQNSGNSKMMELEDVNENLNAQISEYNKLIKRLYENASSLYVLKDSDSEKKRMLDDIKTLRSLSAIKQDRIERLEAKVKTLQSQ